MTVTAPATTTDLPFTFYDRRKMDRRVPLPLTFAVRWIEGGCSAAALVPSPEIGPAR